MTKINYGLKVGNWSVNSTEDPHTEFIALETLLSMNSPIDFCHVTIYTPPGPQPSLLEQTMGTVVDSGFGSEENEAFSVQVRGNDIKHGDQLTVELAAADRSEKVITASVQSIHSSFGQTRIIGTTGMQALANTRLNQTYENQSLKQIVDDLAGQAGVSLGEVETGSTYPYFVVHEAKSVLAHIRELAMRDGLDVYFDTDNKLTIQKFNKSSADHIFYFGIDILDLRLFNRQPTSDHIRVYGESPASNQGTDTWPWLVKDLSPFQSEVGQGSQLLAIQDGATRTKDAADRLSKAKLGAIKDQSTWGRLKILGNPTVKVADAIEIKDSPKPELNGLFKVTSVRHLLNKQEGFLTFLGFAGQGGDESVGNLLGAAGELAGGFGI